MRICMFSLNECNGNFNTVRRLTRTLAGAGHDVRVIAYRTGKTVRCEEGHGARIFRVALYPIDPKILRSVLLPLKLARRLCGLRSMDSAPGPFRENSDDKHSRLHSRFTHLKRRVYWRCYRTLRYLVLLFPYIYLAYIFYYYRSFRLAGKEPADVYHANDLVTLPVAWLWSRLAKGKLVYDSHELWLDRPRLRKRTKLNRFLVRRIESFLIRRTDVNIIAGESSGVELSRRYSIAPPTVILNAPSYRPFEHSSLFRDKLGIPADERIILYMGGLQYGRGIERGIQSLEYLSQVSCVVFGSGPDGYIGELRFFIENKGLANRVYFFESVPFEEVTRYAMSADVGLVLHQNICLNYYYVSPNKLFECMAAGLPVVGSNFPDLKKYIEGYNIGVTCDPESPEEIAAAISYILSDKARYNEMRENALEAAKVFNWENEAEKLVALYEGLNV